MRPTTRGALPLLVCGALVGPALLNISVRTASTKGPAVPTTVVEEPPNAPRNRAERRRAEREKKRR